MIKSRLSAIAALISAAFLFLLCKDPGFFPAADTFSGSAGSTWTPFVAFGSNAFLSWKADPWGLALASLITDPANQNSYQLALAVIFTFGLLLFLKAQRLSLSHACSVSVLTALVIVRLCGADTVVWSAIAWVPWIALALISARRVGELFVAVFILLFAVRASTTAHHAVSIAYAGALLFASLPGESHRQSRNRDLLSLLAWIILIGGYALFHATVEQAVFPQYPQFARVVPDDGIPGITRPLVGHDTPIPVLFHPFVKSASTIPALLLLGCATVLAALGSRSSTLASRASFSAALIAAAVVWDSIPSEYLAQIGPVAAVSRMIPDLFLFPLAPILLALGVTLTAIALAAHAAVRSLIVPLSMIATLGFAIPRVLPGAKIPDLSKAEMFAGIQQEDLAAPEWLEANADIPGFEPIDWQNALNSPSRYVARFFGRGAIAATYLPTFSASEPIGPHLASAWASNHPELLPQLSDGHLETRYSSGGARQIGTERIVFKFKEPLTLSGVALQTGKFVTDFPRGIRVSGGTDCAAGEEPSEMRGEVLAEFPSWQGPPKQTAERLPYFGGQEDVRVPFSRPATVSCLAIEQIGTAQFDWTIAEAGLILSRRPRPSS